MNNVFVRATIVIVITSFIANMAQAQERKCDLGLNYSTEVHSDFGKKTNWINLLSLKGQYKAWQNGELSLNTISIWKTNEERIIDDMQTFSNIEEGNLAINIFLMGYMHRFRNISLFAGIRNVNEDYFIGNYTSLFTNSSCGIYPTLSINYPIANYPLSAMCIHGEFKLNETLFLKNSLYNGTARKLFSEEGSLFTINPKKDGILNVTELDYLSKSSNHGVYTIGSVLYTGNSVFGNSEQEEAKEKTKIDFALWGSVERSVYNSKNKSIGVLLQGSFTPDNRNYCKHYYGAGIVLNSIIPTRNDNTLGVFCNKAFFRENAEIAIEVAWKYRVNDYLTFQPAIHSINSGSAIKTVGLIRLVYSLGAKCTTSPEVFPK